MSNLVNFIRGLSPQAPLQIATITAVNADNTSTVEYADGSVQRARGTSVAVGQPAFIRAGVVEGLAPSRTAFTIEI